MITHKPQDPAALSAAREAYARWREDVTTKTHRLWLSVEHTFLAGYDAALRAQEDAQGEEP